jgi:hypothetical protein
VSSIQSLSFWQQDQNYWSQAASQAQSAAQSDALINVIGDAVTSQSKGLASIATQEALTRTNNSLTAALKSALAQTQSSTSSAANSTTSSSASSNSSSTTSSSAAPTPATGTGTVPLTANTSLLTLGIPQNGDISVSDGTNTTTYISTGSDTVSDLLNAINTNAYGNAQVNAYLNPSGDLVIAAQNTADPVLVGGTFASSIGFGVENNTFQPTTPAASTTSSSSGASSSGATSSSNTSATPSSSGTTGSETSSTGSSSSTTPAATLLNSAYQLQTGGTAELLLASSGSSGTLLNMLA